MIPKIMHAVWFGGNPLPQEHQNYINHWKELHPDWQFMLWTEENFGKYMIDRAFVKDTFAPKKYGFFSDYARFVVLKEFGGVYIDTDVELKKPLDELLNCNFFVGYIFDCSIGTAVIGAEKNSPIINSLLNTLLDNYDKTKQTVVSNEWVTEWFINNLEGYKLDGKRQSLEKYGLEIYPKDYFERLKTNKKSLGGYAEHHCAGSWRKDTFARRFIKPIVKFVLGKKGYEKFTLNRLTKKQKFYDLYKQTIKEEKKK